MALLYIKRYSRTYIQAHKDWIFVFGDNLKRTGYAGQAYEARGEMNAIGIATKKEPAMHPDAFFNNGSYSEWIEAERPAIEMLLTYSHAKRTIIWPLDGIGSGMAQLRARAPSIWDALEDLRSTLERGL